MIRSKSRRKQVAMQLSTGAALLQSSSENVALAKRKITRGHSRCEVELCAVQSMVVACSFVNQTHCVCPAHVITLAGCLQGHDAEWGTVRGHIAEAAHGLRTQRRTLLRGTTSRVLHSDGSLGGSRQCHGLYLLSCHLRGLRKIYREGGEFTSMQKLILCTNF